MCKKALIYINFNFENKKKILICPGQNRRIYHLETGSVNFKRSDRTV